MGLGCPRLLVFETVVAHSHPAEKAQVQVADQVHGKSEKPRGIERHKGKRVAVAFDFLSVKTVILSRRDFPELELAELSAEPDGKRQIRLVYRREERAEEEA